MDWFNPKTRTVLCSALAGSVEHPHKGGDGHPTLISTSPIAVRVAPQ